VAVLWNGFSRSCKRAVCMLATSWNTCVRLSEITAAGYLVPACSPRGERLQNQIPLMVRVLSVADVYDALSSERPYRAAMGHLKSLEIMFKDGAQGGLDPELVTKF